MKTITDLQQIRDLIEAKVLRTGMPREHLRGAIGEPEMVFGQTSKYRVPTTWRYGRACFVFPTARDALEARSHGLTYAYVDNEEGLVTEFILGCYGVLLASDNKKGQ